MSYQYDFVLLKHVKVMSSVTFFFNCPLSTSVALIIQQLESYLPMSLIVISKVVCSTQTRNTEVYSIQPYVIKFVTDYQKVGKLFSVLLKCNTPIAVVLCRWNLPVVSQQIYVVHFIFQYAYPENCEVEFEDTKGGNQNP